MSSLRSFFHAHAELFVIGITTVLVMLGMSIDSPTHSAFGHIDSSCFMMCGRAWMNGMTPYIDFTDSKGPLLWLIYGIGYLLSPRTYHGIFVISCLSYLVTSLIMYRCIRLLIAERRLALWATLLMLLAFFHPLHYETRAEDYAQLFFTISLYYCLYFCYGKDKPTSRLLHTALLIIGICVGALAMIKFTFAAMPIVMVVVILYASRKSFNLRIRVKGIFILILGVTVAIAPFAIYFQAIGALREAVYQYFAVTTSTAIASPLSYLIHGNKIYLVICLTAGLSIATQLSRYRFIPLIIIMWFYAITTQNAIWSYYYNSLNFLAVFPVAAFVIWLEKHAPDRLKKTCVASIVIVIALTVYSSLWGTNHRGHFIHGSTPERTQYELFASHVGKIPHAQILYLNSHCIPACGDIVEALPACQYWFQQSYATAAMKTLQDEQLLHSNPDFVIVPTRDDVHQKLLRDMGYHQLKTEIPGGPFNNKSLFTRHSFR